MQILFCFLLFGGVKKFMLKRKFELPKRYCVKISQVFNLILSVFSHLHTCAIIQISNIFQMPSITITYAR